jgi:uncharacterized membrane protein YfcA
LRSPLLAFVLPVEIAAPVAVLVSITVALVVLARDWRRVDVRSVAWLVSFTLVGIPLGLFLLRNAPRADRQRRARSRRGRVPRALSSWQHSAWQLRSDRLAWLFGLAAGVLRGRVPDERAATRHLWVAAAMATRTLSCDASGILPAASIIGMAGYWAAGLWTAQVDRYFLLSLPAVLLAIAFGRMINTRLETQRFLSVVHAGLLASGAGLFIQVMVRWT